MKGVVGKTKEKPSLIEPEWLPEIDQPANNEAATEEQPVEPSHEPSEFPNAGEHPEEPATSPPETVPPTSLRPQRSRQPPQRYGKSYCHKCTSTTEHTGITTGNSVKEIETSKGAQASKLLTDNTAKHPKGAKLWRKKKGCAFQSGRKLQYRR